MNLIIHDLNSDEWNKISEKYSGWSVVSDTGTIHPCNGCFSCWNRTPGKCVVCDGYENMGYLIHHAEEVVVISRYTYGGFSGFVKNVFDRSLGYVLPQFEVINGETHHKKRYDEDKPFTFIFYGESFSDEEKESARRYVQAVCANIRGHVKELVFRKCKTGEKRDSGILQKNGPAGKVILLNGSMRSADGNSAKLARKLAAQLKVDSETVDLRDYMKDLNALADNLKEAPALVLCVPLYVDGLPSQVIRLLEVMENHRGISKRIYVLANMGLYESSQLANLFSAVRQWCGKMNYDYCGGLGVSAGELLGTLMEAIPFRAGPTRNVAKGMDMLAYAINVGSVTEDFFTEPYRFPRSLYIYIANTSWNRTAKSNGIRPEDLYRKL